MVKKCNACKENKPFSAFYRRYDGKVNTLGGYRYLCKLCDNTRVNIARKNNRSYTKAAQRRSKTPIYKERSKATSKRHRDKCSDMYIRSLMTKKNKHLKSSDINDELIEAWRINLKLKRILRTIKGDQ